MPYLIVRESYLNNSCLVKQFYHFSKNYQIVKGFLWFDQSQVQKLKMELCHWWMGCRSTKFVLSQKNRLVHRIWGMRKTGETNGIFKKIFEPFKITDRVKERESFSKELGIKVNIQHVHFQSQSTATLTLLKIPSFAFDPGHHFSKKKIEYEQRFLA